MNRYALILLAASLASAQTPRLDPSNGRTTYEFKNVDANRAGEIVNFVRQLDRRVLVEFNTTFKTAILQANGNQPQEVIEHAKELMARYDTATKQPRIEFVAYLIRAANRPPKNTPPAMPAILQDAVADMKKSFAYSDYSLLDIQATEVRDHAKVESLMGPDAPGWGATPYFYQIEYGDVQPSSDRKSVYIDHFNFSVRIPVGNGNYQSTGITTNVSISEGQKLVIGKVRTGPAEAVEDIFLVLTIKLL